MATDPGDQLAAEGRDRGHLRASHADRERAIEVLKAAFVQGRLVKDEFDLRVSQAFASRTYAELAAATAGLPAEPTAAQLPKPARADGDRPVLRPGLAITAATALYAGAWAFALLPPWPTDSEGDPPQAIILLLFSTTLFYLLVMALAVGYAIAGRREKRSGGQPPRRPALGAGGQAGRRRPSAGPGGELPPADRGQQHASFRWTTPARRTYTAEPTRCWLRGGRGSLIAAATALPARRAVP